MNPPAISGKGFIKRDFPLWIPPPKDPLERSMLISVAFAEATCENKKRAPPFSVPISNVVSNLLF